MGPTLIAVLAFVAATVPSVVAGQASPLHTGGWNISGSASLTRSHADASSTTSTSASIDPSALYFFTPKLAIGASVALGYSDPNSAWRYGVGPQVRYYIAQTTSKTLPFVLVSVVPEWTRSSVASIGSSTGLSGFDPGPTHLTGRMIASTGAAGITQMVATHVGVTGEAFYTRYSSHVNDSNAEFGSTVDSKSSTYGLSFGLSIFVH